MQTTNHVHIHYFRPDGSTLLEYTDWIEVALAGNLRDWTFTDHTGATITGSQVNYNGQRAGYTASPIEAIN